jgi:4-hydroxy-3-polyprenylbenzoate decarboxylase
VKESKLFGDDIDLTALPTPLLHQHDGGKFLETFGMHIVQTPDGSWTNWSITRNMVHDKRHLVGPIIPKQDIGQIYQMWKDKGEDMPWALCFGVPPAAIMVGGMPIPKVLMKLGLLGRLLGVPLKLSNARRMGFVFR